MAALSPELWQSGNLRDAGRPSRFGGFVGRPLCREGGPESAAQQHHQAVACAASSAHKSRHEDGQRPSGHQPRGATVDVVTQRAKRDICAALEPRGLAGHTLSAVSPMSPGGHKSICLRPFETDTKGEAEGKLRTASCYDRTEDGTISNAAGGPDARFCGEVSREKQSTTPEELGWRKWIKPHRPYEHGACGERQRSEDG